LLDPYCYRCPFGASYPSCGIQCAKHVEEVFLYEDPNTIAALFVEGLVGSNGIIVPPPEYLPMVREICNKYNVLLVSDEVMSGFGRTGKWFAVDNWNVVPDIMTMAKGLTSGYLPLGAVAVNKKISDYFQNHMLWGGLTYNAHPLCCGAAAATMEVYRDENLVAESARKGKILMDRLEAMKAKHACVGDVRGLGLFTVIEMVKDKKTREPLVPWNAAGPDMALSKEVNKRLLEKGLYTYVRWNWLFAVPPLTISDEELQGGLAIIDEVLDWVDTQV
jgi:taurine--2-oxoglutarate transaminase